MTFLTACVKIIFPGFDEYFSVIFQSSYFQTSGLFLKALNTNCQTGNETNSREALAGIIALFNHFLNDPSSKVVPDNVYKWYYKEA